MAFCVVSYLIQTIHNCVQFGRGRKLPLHHASVLSLIDILAHFCTAVFPHVIRGSSFTPGSSGSPWIVNYGIDANTTDGAVGYGQNAERNVVMGVTSWGYQDDVLLDGASFFGVNKEFPGTYGSRGSGNIASLMYDACDNPEFEDWMLSERDPPLCE